MQHKRIKKQKQNQKYSISLLWIASAQTSSGIDAEVTEEAFRPALCKKPD